MYLYARPYVIICPVCTNAMSITAHPFTAKCIEQSCRLYGRQYRVDLPLVKATEVTEP